MTNEQIIDSVMEGKRPTIDKDLMIQCEKESETIGRIWTAIESGWKQSAKERSSIQQILLILDK